MFNFTFHNPTRIIFGKDTIAQLHKYVPANARVLVLYGGGSVLRNGVLAAVRTALAEGPDRKVFEFAGIEPNPHFETCLKAIDLIRTEQCDFLLAVGGGSVIDATKFIAGAAALPPEQRTETQAWEILTSYGKTIQAALPFGTVLTLPATGSEMNNGAVITRAATQDKLSFASRYVYPQFSIMDPTVTYTLPARQVANGVVDAFVHTIEQYLTYPVDARVQDRFAEGLLHTLIEVGPHSVQHADDYDSRANLMWAATMALNGLIGAGVPQDWATHLLGHELTAQHGIDHARTLALMLPAVLKYCRNDKHAKLLQYAERIWNLREGSETQRIDAAIAKTETFFESLGLPTRLSAYQLDASHIPALVAALEKHGLTQLGEHRKITPEVSQKIYELAV